MQSIFCKHRSVCGCTVFGIQSGEVPGYVPSYDTHSSRQPDIDLNGRDLIHSFQKKNTTASRRFNGIDKQKSLSGNCYKAAIVTLLYMHEIMENRGCSTHKGE